MKWLWKRVGVEAVVKNCKPKEGRRSFIFSCFMNINGALLYHIIAFVIWISATLVVSVINSGWVISHWLSMALAKSDFLWELEVFLQRVVLLINQWSTVLDHGQNVQYRNDNKKLKIILFMAKGILFLTMVRMSISTLSLLSFGQKKHCFFAHHLCI